MIEEMLRGTSVIYVTYTDYDEIAHHSGPQRAEALDALDGVDRVLESLDRAPVGRAAAVSVHRAVGPRPDARRHVPAALRPRLEDVIRQLMGGAESIDTAIAEVEEWRVVNTFAVGADPRPGRRRHRPPRAGVRRRSDRDEKAAAAQASADAEADGPELVVCPSGNLALVFFPEIEGRVDLETLNDRYPEMVDALANHPGIGHRDGAVSEATARWRSAATASITCDSGKIDGEDPLQPYGDYAAESLKRLDSMSNCW